MLPDGLMDKASGASSMHAHGGDALFKVSDDMQKKALLVKGECSGELT